MKMSIPRCPKWARDILSTLYDEDGYMSLPRLFCFVTFFMFFVSWILEQIFGKTFEHFGELTGVFGITMASYVGKKFSDRSCGEDVDKQVNP